jgi:Ankyrin repeats (3 copies)
MPVKPLPPNADLDHVKHQAKDLIKAHSERDPQAAQRIREFHPRLHQASDTAILDAPLRFSDAQLVMARERGFASWARLKRHIEKPTVADDLSLPAHERLEDAMFRRAVDLLDAGDVEGLRTHLKAHPKVLRQRVALEGGNYFTNPGLLEFVAENPIRRGALPDNIVAIARVILEAGAKDDQAALDQALGLICSGRVPRECGVQTPLIDLLCGDGANPNAAMSAAIAHGEFEAVDALLRNSARIDLPVAAGLGQMEESQRLIGSANVGERHRALALASQFGHTAIVKLLLDAGEDPSRYNPVGFHSHSTPLHQAVAGGHIETVRLLVARGARLDIKDTLWQGTPEGWAHHEGRTAIEEYLRSLR